MPGEDSAETTQRKFHPLEESTHRKFHPLEESTHRKFHPLEQRPAERVLGVQRRETTFER
jgi:hypothetical protein